jgi:xylose dehydrogenase (NAD/NADP)
MPVNWGIMSTAQINRLFIGGARQADDVHILAVASRDLARAQAYAQQWGIERAHGSYESLLADPDVEVVYISLPNSLHIEWTVKALQAGKHVLCEKPLSRRAHEVREAFDVAEREDRLLMEGFMYRHHPQTRRLAELIAQGAVGRVRMVRAAFSFVEDDPADVRLRSALQGGALMDVGCYCVSSARVVAGEPHRVTAEQTLGGDGVDVAFAATMRFADDVLAHFDAGLSLAPRDELEVVGDQGALFLDDPWHCREPLIELRRESGVERIAVESADPYRLEAENMSAAIRGQAPPLLGREDGLGQAGALQALYEAAESGAAVTLAPVPRRPPD